MVVVVKEVMRCWCSGDGRDIVSTGSGGSSGASGGVRDGVGVSNR